MKLEGHKLVEKAAKVVNSRIFIFAVCVVFVILSALYYYGMQCEYPPDAENIMTISAMYSHLVLGMGYPAVEVIYRLCAFLSTKIGGMSYFAVRLHFTLLYAILLALTVFLCVKPKNGQRAKLYLLPLIALLSVILYPVADKPELFQVSVGGELIYTWPFHYHYTARIFTLVCLVLLLFLLKSQTKKTKIIYGILLLAVCLYALKYTDLVFYIMFLAPAVIVLFLYALHSLKYRKACYVFMTEGMILLLLSKLLPADIKGILWTKDAANVYGAIYGATNWISTDLIGEHLLDYIDMNFVLFNIQLPESPVISLYTIVFVLKIAILIVGYFMIFHIMKCSIIGTGMKYGYDWVDEILAWSYVLLTIIFLFTDLGGGSYYFKYYGGLVTIMTILICRNMETLSKIIDIDFIKGIKHKKLLIFVYTFILCICSMGKTWTYHAPDKYNDELEAMIDYIEGTDYGYVVAPYWIYPRVSAISEGKVMAYRREEDIKDIYGDDAKVAYIITNNYENPDNTWENSMLTWYDNCEDYEDICEYYSEPTNIIHFNNLQLVVFEDGMERIKENDRKYPFP